MLWEMGSQLIFISPCVYQKRNIHDFHKDFRQEIELYLRAGELVEALNDVQLSGSVPEMLTDIYRDLVAKSFFDKRELTILREWLRFF